MSGPPDNPGQTVNFPGVNLHVNGADCVTFDEYEGVYFTAHFVPGREGH